jgi:hypothetical protein
MNLSNIGCTLSVAAMTLALTAITQVSHAASEMASETQSVSDTTTAQPVLVTAVAEQHRAGNRSPLTLYVEDANGKALQLVYVEGTGWKYRRPKSHDNGGSSLFRKIASWSMTSAPVAKDIAQKDEALTVFIDGPTGFTYVWSRDGGWKFVGTLSDRKS